MIVERLDEGNCEKCVAPLDGEWWTVTGRENEEKAAKLKKRTVQM